MNTISDIMFWISTGLLVPVVILLIALLIVLFYWLAVFSGNICLSGKWIS